MDDFVWMKANELEPGYKVIIGSVDKDKMDYVYTVLSVKKETNRVRSKQRVLVTLESQDKYYPIEYTWNHNIFAKKSEGDSIKKRISEHPKELCFDFSKALNMMKNGFLLSRKAWGDEKFLIGFYHERKGINPSYIYKNNRNEVFLLSTEDISSDDWFPVYYAGF